MPTYFTPGVYYERADADHGAIAPLRTDIAGFVGIARRGPLHRAFPVASWRQFVAVYGDFTGAGYLAYGVRAFFENGGRRCWVVRVASAAAATARTIQEEQVPPPPSVTHPWNLEASSPGVWGNDLEAEWRQTHRAQTTADPASSTPEFAAVASVAGFERGTHVRVTQGPVTDYRVVSAVDPDRRRLYWVHPLPRNSLPYEQPLRLGSVRPLVDSIEYTLLVHELGRLHSVVERLSLTPEHARYGPRVLPLLRLPPDGLAAGARPLDDAPPPVVIVERRDPATVVLLQPFAVAALARRALAGGLDGLAALRVRDFVGEPAALSDDDTTGRSKRAGLRALEPISEVALVAVPDIHIRAAAPPRKRPPPVCVPDPCLPAPPVGPAVPRVPSTGDLPPRFGPEAVFEVEQAMVEHCALLHDRFALLDPPFDTVRSSGSGIGPLRAWRRRFDSDLAGLYAPWLLVPDPLLLDPSGLRAVPPSGHVAGFIARTDLTVGVHRAPANGALAWIQGTTLTIDDSQHGVLNPEHVNAIRSFAGRGLRIFGARTLSSNPAWRFVNVRRLLLMLEKAIRLGIQWATFEPHNRQTRAKLHLALTSLLLEVWRRGALAGRTAAEAFYVNCGEVENPPAIRDRGMLVAEVGVAPTTPFEFIVVRVGVSDNALEVHETGAVEAMA
jgi:phage tail sheath protein FI